MHAGTRAAITRMTTDKPAWLPQEAATHGVSQARGHRACALALCRFGGPAIVAPGEERQERQTGSFATPAFARVCPKLLLPFCRCITSGNKGMLHCTELFRDVFHSKACKSRGRGEWIAHQPVLSRCTNRGTSVAYLTESVNCHPQMGNYSQRGWMGARRVWNALAVK
ncbi:hypothetical protein GCM10009107_39740 [Ideonella azotifigens]|uniref:Uncharacterized protein n=1 Tax=Ideonella azotifigens TaxID=513160 RepID=A0ABN1K981_9BURK